MDMVLMMVGKIKMVFEQVVKVEVCLSEGFACDIVADGHQTVCRQKFTSHRWSLIICSVKSSLHLTKRHYWYGKPVFFQNHYNMIQVA